MPVSHQETVIRLQSIANVQGSTAAPSASVISMLVIWCSEASLAAVSARSHSRCHWSAQLPIDDCFDLSFSPALRVSFYKRYHSHPDKWRAVAEQTARCRCKVLSILLYSTFIILGPIKSSGTKDKSFAEKLGN